MALQTITNPGSTTQQTTQARTFYDAALLDPLDDNLAVLLFAEDLKIEPKAGQTISKRRLERLAAKSNPLTEGTQPSPSDLTFTEVTVTCGQYGDYVEWTDWFDLTAPDANVIGVLREQGRQAALSIDTAAQSTFLAGTNVSYANGKAARNQLGSADKINAQLLDDVIALLKNRGVPMITRVIPPVAIAEGDATAVVSVSPCYVAIVTPTIEKSLKYVPSYVPVRMYESPSNPKLPGEIGAYENLRFISVTNGFRSATGGAGSIPVGIGLAFGAGAFGRARISSAEMRAMLHPVDMASVGDALGQKGSVGWKAVAGFVRLNESKMQRFEMAE